jgi:hypothetical protein
MSASSRTTVTTVIVHGNRHQDRHPMTVAMTVYVPGDGCDGTAGPCGQRGSAMTAVLAAIREADRGA